MLNETFSVIFKHCDVGGKPDFSKLIHKKARLQVSSKAVISLFCLEQQWIQNFYSF